MAKERFERGKPKMSFDEIASKVTCPNEVRKSTLQKMQMIQAKLEKKKNTRHQMPNNKEDS